MRWLGILMGLALLGGCAATKPAQPVAMPMTRPAYEDAPAGALVFAAPITQDDPKMFLAREGRSLRHLWDMRI